jgi:hypothetical protein
MRQQGAEGWRTGSDVASSAHYKLTSVPTTRSRDRTRDRIRSDGDPHVLLLSDLQESLERNHLM